MKKVILLLLLSTFTLTSCGPRRYRCGPYRKCEKEVKKNTDKIEIQNQKKYILNS
ncbi:MAG: hypothetical protein R2790_02735 [Flavobacterium haoranii]